MRSVWKHANFDRQASSKWNLNSLASALRSCALWTVKYSFRHGLPSVHDISDIGSERSTTTVKRSDRCQPGDIIQVGLIQLHLGHLVVMHLYSVLMDWTQILFQCWKQLKTKWGSEDQNQCEGQVRIQVHTFLPLRDVYRHILPHPRWQEGHLKPINQPPTKWTVL